MQDIENWKAIPKLAAGTHYMLNPHMEKEHTYKTTIQWTGNRGLGTQNYKVYDRDHIISIENKMDILGSSDPAFRGDKTRHNPEELLVSSLSACHMLWYLHLCAVNNVVVVAYTDTATSIMNETANGGGYFTEVNLHPVVTITDQSMIDTAKALHHQANQMCFIANSVNFPVKHQPVIKVAS